MLPKGKEVLARLANCRMVVLGDAVLDRYIHGETDRVSREAPVLVVREEGRTHSLGGAANTAHNLVALGAKTTLVSLVGSDESGQTLARELESRKIDTGALVRSSDHVTTVKTRILAGALHTTKQQMLRIDREEKGAPTEQALEALSRSFHTAIEGADAVIVSDYGFENLIPTYVALAVQAKRAGKIVVVDSRYALTRYEKMTAVTPNEPEASQATGMPVKTESQALHAAEHLKKNLAADYVLLTRGKEGSVLVSEKGSEMLSAHGDHRAADVTGAGDTVVASFTAALVTLGDATFAARFANASASEVVKHPGAVPCSAAMVLQALEQST